MDTRMNEGKTGNVKMNNAGMSNTNVNGRNGEENNSKLKEFFKDQLKDIYWAEKNLVSALPKMQQASHNEDLKNAFANHLKETRHQVERLEKIFNLIGKEAEAEKCPAMAGIIDEGEEIISQTEDGTAQRDVGLIFAGQKAEHYEIATYGGLVTLAKTLGLEEAARLLHETLTEEKEADEMLTRIAEKNVNRKASREPVEA